MDKSNETKTQSKLQKDNKAKDNDDHSFTDKKRKNKEAKIIKLGGF